MTQNEKRENKRDHKQSSIPHDSKDDKKLCLLLTKTHGKIDVSIN